MSRTGTIQSSLKPRERRAVMIGLDWPLLLLLTNEVRENGHVAGVSAPIQTFIY